MSDRHVIIGAGPVGQAVATELARRGADVVLASRSGSGPELPGARRVAVDAADTDALSRLAEGAQVLYNCVNPPRYDAWTTMWPPIAAALLAAAERTGAVLAITGNLYPYGPVEGAMVEGMPDAATGTKARIRARMTADALALHHAGRIRAVEVRGSDYVGAPLGDHAHVPRVIPAALKGKTVRVIGSAGQPHTWTDVHDMGRALVAVSENDSTLGRVWHAPSNAPRTQAEAVNDVLASVGKAAVTVKAYPKPALWTAGLFDSQLRELRETEYQFTRPYVMDSSAITAELGLAPSPWDEVCRRTAGA
jgi:nucleoside-diphosphate-sugar epimerase